MRLADQWDRQEERGRPDVEQSRVRDDATTNRRQRRAEGKNVTRDRDGMVKRLLFGDAADRREI